MTAIKQSGPCLTLVTEYRVRTTPKGESPALPPFGHRRRGVGLSQANRGRREDVNAFALAPTVEG
jgi:hypothetical protein